MDAIVEEGQLCPEDVLASHAAWPGRRRPVGGGALRPCDLPGLIAWVRHVVGAPLSVVAIERRDWRGALHWMRRFGPLPEATRSHVQVSNHKPVPLSLLPSL